MSDGRFRRKPQVISVIQILSSQIPNSIALRLGRAALEQLGLTRLDEIPLGEVDAENEHLREHRISFLLG